MIRPVALLVVRPAVAAAASLKIVKTTVDKSLLRLTKRRKGSITIFLDSLKLTLITIGRVNLFEVNHDCLLEFFCFKLIFILVLVINSIIQVIFLFSEEKLTTAKPDNTMTPAIAKTSTCTVLTIFE